jgi:hypothetical protein
MLQNESCRYLLLQIIKDFLTDLDSFKKMILLNQLHHELSDLQEIFYKSSIEIVEVNKDLHMSQRTQHFSVSNYIYLSKVHSQIIDEYQ